MNNEINVEKITDAIINLYIEIKKENEVKKNKQNLGRKKYNK